MGRHHPDYQQDSVLPDIMDIKGRLKRAGKNPPESAGYTTEFTDIPLFGLIDIFNFMTFNKSDENIEFDRAFESEF